jgi:2-hydroxychromene-2-carboxylate isomerase
MARAKPKLEFWYELASTYSYLSAMRIEPLAVAAGVEIVWRPFLLGPIFKAQGWNTSPFNIYPAKGRYMVRDIERTAGQRGLAFRMPEPFPANSLKATRLAMLGGVEGWVPKFTRAVFLAEFAERRQIGDHAVLAQILEDLQLDPARLLARIEGPDVKAGLKARTAEALRCGIFGAPSFISADAELFWGDDRIEAALSWACRSFSAHSDDTFQ